MKPQLELQAAQHPTQTPWQQVVLISHFALGGALPTCVKRLVLDLRHRQWQVLLVSTNLSESSRSWCKSAEVHWLIRRNLGRDFGAFNDAWHECESLDILKGCEKLILLNDSVYLRCDHANSLWAKFLDGDPKAVVGITDSFQNGYHLQSYALNIPSSVFKNAVWVNFWAGFNPRQGTAGIIENGEIGLSKVLQRAGVSLRPLQPVVVIRRLGASKSFHTWIKGQLNPIHQQMALKAVADLGRTSSCLLNPSHQLVLPLLFNGLPLIKRDLLEANSSSVPDPLQLADSANWIDAQELTEYLKPPRIGFKGRSLWRKILSQLHKLSTS